MWLEQRESSWREFETTLSRASMEGDTIFNVENIQRSILEYKQSEEAGAEIQASKNQVLKGRHDLYISEQAHYLQG